MQLTDNLQLYRLPAKFQSWMPYQREAVEFILNSTKKVSFLEMPTGTGKTLVAKASFNISGWQGSILTNNTDLQNQYKHDFSELQLLKGRTHFICDIDQSVTAADAACTAGFQCPYKYTHDCAYYSQILNSKTVSVTIENYPFFLNHQVYSEDKRKIEMVFCDEGHHLGDQLKQFASFTISTSEVKAAGLPDSPQSVDPIDWLVWAKSIQTQLNQQVEQAITDLNRKPETGHFWQESIVPSFIEVQKHKTSIQLNRKIRLLLDYSGTDLSDWFVQSGKVSGVTEFRMVESRGLFKIIDEIAEKRVVIASATLGDIDHIAKQLNIVDYDKFVVPDLYSKTNRPIFYIKDAGRFSAKDDPNKKTFSTSGVEAIDAVLSKHVGEKGIIHTVSHERAKIVLLNSANRPRLLSHKPNGTMERADAIKRFKQDTTDRVLVSPSILEGIDLPEDECRFIIFAKTPFDDPREPLMQEILKREGWEGIVHRLIIKTKQGIGRGIRSLQDRCAIYLIDEAFDVVLLNSEDEIFRYIQAVKTEDIGRAQS
jgi:ATP-dependent DNA helicase DinG